MQLNSTIYYANFPSNVEVNSIILSFTLYLNNTYYQTPESVFLQIGSSNQFTTYFSFSNKQVVDMVTFSLSNPDHTSDELEVSRSIIYRNEAPPGEYRSTVTATVISRDDVGLIPKEDTEMADLAFTVMEGKF